MNTSDAALLNDVRRVSDLIDLDSPSLLNIMAGQGMNVAMSWE
jgi:hypothetical protein